MIGDLTLDPFEIQSSVRRALYSSESLTESIIGSSMNLLNISILPEFPFWSREEMEESETLENIEPYSSDTNVEWLSKDDLKIMIDGIVK